MPLRDIQSGRRYKITNVKNTERVLDLSGTDNRSIIGYGSHGGDNQKWELQQDSEGWTFRNISTGLYATVEGQRDSHNNYPNGTKVIGTQQPYKWHIWKENEGELNNNSNAPAKFRISVPNVKKSLDLSNHGQGPDIEIWGQWDGENQLWYFDEGVSRSHPILYLANPDFEELEI